MIEAQLLIVMGIISIFIGSIMFLIGNSISSNKGKSELPEDSFYKRSDYLSGYYPDSTDKSSGPEVKGGGIIMLGPIPIIFGTDSKSIQTVILLAIVLMLLAYLIFRRVSL